MKNGFTLVETIVVASIAGAGAVSLISYQGEEAKKTKALSFIKEVNQVISAVDHRIAIDGYDPDLWGNTSWNNIEDVKNKLIKKDLVSVDSNCPDGNWNPSLNSAKKTNLLKCGLWSEKNSYDLNMSAKMNLDSVGFIQSFDLIISFNDEEEFKDNFLNLKKSIKTVEANNKQEISGIHLIEFVEKNNINNQITSMECLSNYNNCAIKANYDRAGGNEYIRSDGNNSMIGEHLTFIETKGSSPFKCLKWTNDKRDGTGNWSASTIEDDCGIGVYKNGTNPVVVDVVADNATFKNVLLDKECKTFEWSGNDVIAKPKTVPCGMTNDGTELYQVIQNSIAETALFSELKTSVADINYASIKDLSVKTLNVDEIITPLINVDVLTVANEMNIDGIASFKNLVEFDNKVKFNKVVDFNEFVTFNKDVELKGLTTISNLEVKEDFNAKSLNVETINSDILNSNNIVSNVADIQNVNSVSINSDNGNINKINSKNIESTNLKVSNLIEAPNFINIENDLEEIRRAINDLSSNKPDPKPDPVLIKQYVFLRSYETTGGWPGGNGKPKDWTGEPCDTIGEQIQTSQVIGTNGNYARLRIRIYSCQLIAIE